MSKVSKSNQFNDTFHNLSDCLLSDMFYHIINKVIEILVMQFTQILTSTTFNSKIKQSDFPNSIKAKNVGKGMGVKKRHNFIFSFITEKEQDQANKKKNLCC